MKAERAMITSTVNNIAVTMLPETLNADSPAEDASIASYFRILLNFSMMRVRKPSPLVSGEPLYLDLVVSRPETSVIAEIISGAVLLAITAGAFAWFLGALSKFQLFLAPLAFGVELAAFILRWKAEVALDDCEEDMVMTITITHSRNRDIPLALGRGMNPVMVSITTAKLSSSEDCSIPMGCLIIAGAIVAGVSLIAACGLHGLQCKEISRFGPS
mmetsp:Transcript_27099/g.48978  ORF Transcript_27099/g.48978 Transcript_27099/m.48978 type:complete len:216 (-) Transcript_27099:675-1322(-)